MLQLYTKYYATHKYTCVDFVCDAWKYLFNVDISNVVRLPVSYSSRYHFTRLVLPTSPCIAYMLGEDNHIGLYYEGKILHLTKNGVEYMRPNVASRGFRTVRYYAYNCNR